MAMIKNVVFDLDLRLFLVVALALRTEYALTSLLITWRILVYWMIERV